MNTVDYFWEKVKPYELGEYSAKTKGLTSKEERATRSKEEIARKGQVMSKAERQARLEASQKYWTDRQKIQQRILDRTDQRTVNKIIHEYQSLYKDIMSEYEQHYLNLQEKINNGEQITNTDILMVDRYYQMQAEIKDRMDKMNITYDKTLKDHLVTAYQSQYKGIGKSLNIKTLPSQKAIKNIVTQPWTNDGKIFSERIWQNQTQLTYGLANTFTNGLLQGKSWTKISKELQKEFGKTAYQVDRLVRTESAHIMEKASTDCYKDAGVEKIKVISYDCCDECQEVINEGYYDIDDDPVPVHVNCRCFSIPVYVNGEGNEE